MIRRFLEPSLRHSLRHFPAVMLVGARQVGKSTLAQQLCGSSWPARYLTLDERATLDSALLDPDGFVRGAGDPVVIDEVQRAPDLLRAIKLEVDRDRRPGRFLLTGSANILTLSKVSETLAGRVAVHHLWPLSWAERREQARPQLLDALFEADDSRDLIRRYARPDALSPLDDPRAFILAGGYPTPALMDDERARHTWFEGFRQTYIERDLRDLAHIANLPEFSRLMAIVALRTSRLLNASELAREIRLPNTTLRRYLHLLEQTFQIALLMPYATNRAKRLVKTPKLFATDTGLACHLAAAFDWPTLDRRNLAGPMLETFVHSEIRKLADLAAPRPTLSFWRSHDGDEVDVLIERGDEVVGIETKASATINRRDISGLEAARDALGKRWRMGVVLHGGTDAVAFGDRTIALPIAAALRGEPVGRGD